MNILETVQKNFPQAIAHISAYRKVGKGIDGEVFLFKEKRDRVVKFGALFLESSTNNIDVFNYNMTYMIEHNPHPFVRVYEYVYLGNAYVDEKQVALYYAIMDKLEAISDDEKKIFYTLVSHQDANKIKDLSDQVVESLLFSFSMAFDFDEAKVKNFCKAIKNSHIKHLDLHERNIMKDSQGNFQLIDLDRIQISQK